MIIPMIDGKQEQLSVEIYTQISRNVLALNKTFPPKSLALRTSNKSTYLCDKTKLLHSVGPSLLLSDVIFDILYIWKKKFPNIKYTSRCK